MSLIEEELGIKLHNHQITSYNEIVEVDKNPFIQELKIDKRIVLKRFKKGEIVDNEQGNLPLSEAKALTEENEQLKDKGVEIGKRINKQRAKFILLYNEPLLDYRNLSEISLKMLFFIFERKLNLGNDTVLLSINECCTELNASRPTVTKGFVELIRAKLLAKKYDNVWYINPCYFFAGNRERIMTND